MYHTIKYVIQGVTLFAVEHDNGRIEKYCNTKEAADDTCNEMNGVNQCDGCRQGLTVTNGIHRTEGDKPFMCCTKHLYT